MRSVWLFPVLLAIPLVLFTALKIHGSSIGIYNQYFYGNANDEDLIANRPRAIRSDEWIVNSQMTIAQANNNFERINTNIGNGQDMSLLVDVPYKDWSTIFKPHNWAFFVLPFDNAFAFRWWLMAYLVMVSCYLFVMQLVPGKRLMASLLSIGLFFSPLIQWWYLHGTLGSIYFSLFGGVVLMKLLSQKRLRGSLLWSLPLIYVLVCFALILYPPFQIPCVLALFAFGVGYLLEKRSALPPKIFWQKLGIIVGACVIAGSIVLLFLFTRAQAVETIRNTAYPGKRVEKSGGFDAAHLFSSHLSFQHQFTAKANAYSLPEKGLANQSENSNFILVAPFLILPSVYLLWQDRRKGRKLDWPLLGVTAGFIFILLWLFVPGLDPLGKIALLELVPTVRFLIGLGILNIALVALIIRRLQKERPLLAAHWVIIVYCAVIFAIQVWLGLYAKQRFPEFISLSKILAFSLPIPVIVYCLLKKYFVLAALGFAAFSAFSTLLVNPLYQSTDIISKTPLSLAIQRIANQDDHRWVSDEGAMENIITINGARSLNGVYAYPQLDLWKSLPVEEDIYNRYAHTNFVFDRDTSTNTPTTLKLIGGDNFGIYTEPCGDFLREKDVKFILTAVMFDVSESCLALEEKVPYPTLTFYIYQLKH
jgi:hypothetical protein